MFYHSFSLPQLNQQIISFPMSTSNVQQVRDYLQQNAKQNDQLFLLMSLLLRLQIAYSSMFNTRGGLVNWGGQRCSRATGKQRRFINQGGVKSTSGVHTGFIRRIWINSKLKQSLMNYKKKSKVLRKTHGKHILYLSNVLLLCFFNFFFIRMN